MTIIRTCILLAAATGTLATAAFGVYHLRRAEVNGRLYGHSQRINPGVRDGQLTHQEAQQLRRNDRSMYREERSMAHLDGGHIAKADQRSLN